MRQLKITNRITSRESISLDKYLNDIGKIDLLTPDQEIDLARRIKKGDEVALEQMTNANLRFVVSVAKQYQNQGLSLSDLINEGNVGLIKAAKRFDETRGFKFISYAVWWIRQAILLAIVEHSRIVRLPMNKVAAYNKVNDAYSQFLQQHEREPLNEELAEILGITVREVRNVIKGSARHMSMDAPIGNEEGDMNLIDTMSMKLGIEPETDIMKDSLVEEVAEGMKLLSPREVEVISCYYGLNGEKSRTLEEIGHLFCLTRERVRQIKERALKRLRRAEMSSDLKAYLG